MVWKKNKTTADKDSQLNENANAANFSVQTSPIPQENNINKQPALESSELPNMQFSSRTNVENFMNVLHHERLSFHVKWSVGWLVSCLLLAFVAWVIAYSVLNKIPWESAFSCIPPLLLSQYILFANFPFKLPKKYDNLRLQKIYLNLIKAHINAVWLFWCSFFFGLVGAIVIWIIATAYYSLDTMQGNITLNDALKVFLYKKIWLQEHHVFLIVLVIFVSIVLGALIFFFISWITTKKRLHAVANFMQNVNLELDSVIESKQNKRNFIKLLVFLLIIFLPLLFLLIHRKKVKRSSKIL